MAKPVKEFSIGKVRVAVFQGEYKGKTTYSFKFQKSYKDEGKGEWVNTEYFYPTDLRDLHILVGKLVINQVKERTPEPEPQPELESEPESDLPF